MAEPLWLDGGKINFENPPEPTKLVKWSKTTIFGGRVQGSYRTIAHIDRLNNLAASRFNSAVAVIQSCYNTSVAASAGTHDYDAVLDVYIPGVNWWTQQRFFRANGFACWYRHCPEFCGNEHIHGMTIPADGHDFRTRVGIYVPGQLSDYYNNRNGLASHSHDGTWHPSSIKATIFDLRAYNENQRAEDKVTKAKVKAAIGWDRVRVDAVQPGKENKDVERVKWALKHKLGADNVSFELEGDGKDIFGDKTRDAYRAWQRKLGYTGSDANGEPGPKSLRRLGLEVVN